MTKRGSPELGQGLVDLGYEVVSTGGTLAALQAAGVPVTAVSDVTGFPEILDGRVKSLHPHIHGGLLARRDDPAHMSALETHQISPIDVVAANLYPFAETVARRGVALADALEQIDIGGPAMIRAAAKNFPGVVVLTDPADYTPVLDELRDGTLSDTRRRALAAKAFAHTAAYDAVVAEYLRDPQEWPQEVAFAGRLARTLRYGENPQQRAAAYRRLRAGEPERGVLEAEQLAGKELSFNNLLDADAAWNAVRGLCPTGRGHRQAHHSLRARRAERPGVGVRRGLARRPGFGVRRHRRAQSPGRRRDGPAHGGDLLRGRRRAGIRRRDARDTGEAEVSAPVAHALRCPRHRLETAPHASWDVRPIAGGLLVQTADCDPADPTSWRVVTAREPNAQEMDDLAFAWHAVRHVKSNAIVLARDRALTGVGSGQPNRLESVRIAVDKAGERAAGSVLASDAFFPFPDGLETAIAAGVTAAIQPGGSVRDEAVIAAADRAGVAMVFTGTRHFRH